MTAHDCTTLTYGCYRCDLNIDELRSAADDMKIEEHSLRAAIEVLQDRQAELREDAEAIYAQIIAYEKQARKNRKAKA